MHHNPCIDLACILLLCQYASSVGRHLSLLFSPKPTTPYCVECMLRAQPASQRIACTSVLRVFYIYTTLLRGMCLRLAVSDPVLKRLARSSAANSMKTTASPMLKYRIRVL